MQRLLHLLAVSALAVSVGCTQQRGSEKASETGDTSRQTGTAEDRGGAAATAPADQKAIADTSKLTQDDRQFVKEAAQGGMLEVQLGQLALEKSKNDEVKQLAQRIIDDHQQANQRLQNIASAKQIDSPTQLDRQHQEQISKLQNLSGPRFDKAYVQGLVQDHTKDIAEFRSHSNSTQDAALKDFTTSTLPTLEQHLQQSKEVSAKLR
jgi:putative membrane protein